MHDYHESKMVLTINDNHEFEGVNVLDKSLILRQPANRRSPILKTGLLLSVQQICVKCGGDGQLTHGSI